MSYRILIADDTEVMRTMIKLALSSAGFQVVGEASSGEEAVQLYQTLRPDAVTLDITMGGIDGIETARQIRDLDPNVRFVMVTALGQEDRIRQAVEVGAKDFVVKPFEPDRIISAVKTALGLS